MKKVLLVLGLGLIFLLVGCGNSKEDIVIYTSMEEARNKDLITMINEKFPEYKIIVQHMPTGNNAAKIKTEGKNIEADIILGLEMNHMENLKDNFADLTSFDTSHYLDNLNPNHKKYLIWEKYTASIIIDKTYFEKHNLEVPKTYDDLLKDDFKNLIAMPDPKTSGTGYMYYLNVVNIMGKEKALEYFSKLSNNIKQFTTSGSGPINLLKQGEIAIAMAMTYQGANEITNGANFQMIEFDTGTPYNFTGISIIEGKQNETGVKEIFDWIITDFMKYDRENYVPGQVLKEQKNNAANFPSNLEDANMKDIESITKKEMLISEWKY